MCNIPLDYCGFVPVTVHTIAIGPTVPVITYSLTPSTSHQSSPTYVNVGIVGVKPVPTDVSIHVMFY